MQAEIIRLGDVDGDGDLDVISAATGGNDPEKYLSGSLVWIENRLLGHPAPTASPSSEPSGQPSSSPTTSNFGFAEDLVWETTDTGEVEETLSRVGGFLVDGYVNEAGFGCSVSMTDSYAIVGASGARKAFIFAQAESTGEWGGTSVVVSLHTSASQDLGRAYG